MNPGDANVVRIVALVHQPVVADLRSFFHDDLGHAVVQVGDVTDADVALHDRAFGLPPSHHKHPGMGGEPFLVRRYEHQVNGAFDPRALGHMNQRAVANERGIERGKAVVLDRG